MVPFLLLSYLSVEVAHDNCVLRFRLTHCRFHAFTEAINSLVLMVVEERERTGEEENLSAKFLSKINPKETMGRKKRQKIRIADSHESSSETN